MLTELYQALTGDPAEDDGIINYIYEQLSKSDYLFQ